MVARPTYLWLERSSCNVSRSCPLLQLCINLSLICSFNCCPIHIRPTLQQKLHHLDAAGSNSHVEGGMPCPVNVVDVGHSGHQEPGSLGVVMQDRQLQGGAAIAVNSVDACAF
eukprot:scaffold181739_cov14-Prasinocladus_malaysianus.AAC.2